MIQIWMLPPPFALSTRPHRFPLSGTRTPGRNKWSRILAELKTRAHSRESERAPTSGSGNRSASSSKATRLRTSGAWVTRIPTLMSAWKNSPSWSFRLRLTKIRLSGSCLSSSTVRMKTTASKVFWALEMAIRPTIPTLT